MAKRTVEIELFLSGVSAGSLRYRLENVDFITGRIDKMKAQDVIFGRRLEAYLKGNPDNVSVIGGHIPADLTGYYEGVVRGLEVFRAHVPEFSFKAPELELDLPADVDF